MQIKSRQKIKLPPELRLGFKTDVLITTEFIERYYLNISLIRLADKMADAIEKYKNKGTEAQMFQAMDDYAEKRK